MRVEKIKIVSYKTIVSEQELDVDPITTILIGGNETGKTNVLEAIDKFSLDKQFETEDISRSSNHYSKGTLPSVGIVFSLSEEDQQKMAEILPISWSPSKLEIWKKGNSLDDYYVAISKEETAKIFGNEETLRKEIATLSKEVTQERSSRQATNEELDSMMKRLATTPLPASKAQRFQNRRALLEGKIAALSVSLDEKESRLADDRKTLNELSQITKKIKGELLNLTKEETKSIFQLFPKIYFLGKIEYLSEKTPISSLISQPTKDKNKVVENLLKLGGITDLSILKEDTRRRSVALRRAGRTVSEQLSQIWKQENIDFQMTADEKTLTINLGEPISISASPEERSDGFKWFLSFYVQFIADTRAQLRNTLILLDDPAVHLHPKGQKDFLAILDGIGENNQMIYTAHSPFLINKNFPGRTRLLTKKKAGTLINNKPYSNGKSRFWEPLRSAIGVSLGDSLFLGGKNLIVEGVSDQIILTGFSHKSATTGKPYIDLEEIAIVPGMGADSLVQIASLAYSEKLPTMILLDSDKKGDSIVQKLDKKMPKLKEDVEILRIKDFETKAETIEDLIPIGDYLKAVNSAYSRTIDGFKKMNEKDFIGKKEAKEAASAPKEKENNISIAQLIVERFKEHTYGDFDKVLVAKELVSMIGPKELENDEYKHLGKLFEKVKEHFKG